MPTQMKAQSAVGSAIQAARQSLGLSREALGAAAGGVSSSTIRRVEHGVVTPHPSTLAALQPRRDGRRLLFKRDELDAYLEASR